MERYWVNVALKRFRDSQQCIHRTRSDGHIFANVIVGVIAITVFLADCEVSARIQRPFAAGNAKEAQA